MSVQMDALAELILQLIPKIVTQVFDSTIVSPVCCFLASDSYCPVMNAARPAVQEGWA
jgi:hypothetical protein